MKRTIRLVIAGCLAAWAAFLSSGCVDAPADGQVYLCTVSDAGTGERLFEVERCGPQDDAPAVAWDLAAELAHIRRAVSIDCRGTRRACAWEP